LHQVGDLFELNVNLRCQNVKGRNRLRVFGNRVPKKIFGPKRGTVTQSGDYDIRRSFMIFDPLQILLG
jgi:methyl coenzyme M reductase subunit D